MDIMDLVNNNWLDWSIEEDITLSFSINEFEDFKVKIRNNGVVYSVSYNSNKRNCNSHINILDSSDRQVNKYKLVHGEKWLESLIRDTVYSE